MWINKDNLWLVHCWMFVIIQIINRRLSSYLSGTVYMGKKTAWFTDFPITSYRHRQMQHEKHVHLANWLYCCYRMCKTLPHIKCGSWFQGLSRKYIVCVGWCDGTGEKQKRKLDSWENSQRVSADTARSHSPSSAWQSAKTFGEMKETAEGSLDKPNIYLLGGAVLCEVKPSSFLHFLRKDHSSPFRCVLSCKNFSHWFPFVLGGDTRSSSSSFRYCKYPYERNQTVVRQQKKDLKLCNSQPPTWPTRSTLKYFPLRSKSSSFYESREQWVNSCERVQRVHHHGVSPHWNALTGSQQQRQCPSESSMGFNQTACNYIKGDFQNPRRVSQHLPELTLFSSGGTCSSHILSIAGVGRKTVFIWSYMGSYRTTACRLA